jgi:homoserine dehydrogenase
MRNSPLKVGVAGLGTVGAALVSQISRQRDALSARCGRAIEVVAVCARSRAKDRGIDLRKLKWFADPLSLAR